MFDSFYSTTSEIIDKHIPVKQLSKNELKFQSKPWISPAMKVSIHVKNSLGMYKKYLKTKSSYYHRKFKYYRNKLNHLLKINKRQYYNKYFLENINDSKRVWNGIKQIINFKSPTNQRVVKVIANDNAITDSHVIVNAFNDYFSNIGKDLANLIPTV